MFGVKRAVILPMMLAAIAACQPALAQLNDSQEPGSVLVFPFFQVGFTSSGTSVSTFAISVTCPNGVICPLHEAVTLRLEWVGPGCVERDFLETTTVNGTIVVTPNDGGIIPFPPTPQGYLLAWVINPLTGGAIKFDGLIGKANIREFPQADAAYNAIPIQAAAALANMAPISPANGPLPFNGTTGYKAVTGQITGSVFPPAGQLMTSLVLLTLDALSNRPNGPTFVDFNFYDPNENPISNSFSFTCWGIVPIANLGITNPGIFQSGPALNGGNVPVTLLGLIMTTDLSGGGPGGPDVLTTNFVSLLNNSVPVPTTFVPEGATPTPPASSSPQ